MTFIDSMLRYVNVAGYMDPTESNIANAVWDHLTMECRWARAEEGA